MEGEPQHRQGTARTCCINSGNNQPLSLPTQTHIQMRNRCCFSLRCSVVESEPEL
jgi:hypothetical protein